MGGDGVNLRAGFQKGQLRGHLKGGLAVGQLRREGKNLFGRLETAARPRPALPLPGGAGDANAVRVFQPFFQPFCRLNGAHVPLPRKLFGQFVEFGDVVVAGVEKIAHFLERHELGRAQFAAVDAQTGRPGFFAFLIVASAFRQPQQGARHCWHVRRQFADFGQRDGFFVFRLFVQQFAQIGDVARFVDFRKTLHINAQHGIEFEQHRHGQRALVALQLVQIAGR